MRHAPLVAIVLGALFVASMWLVRVPFMQESDEQAHADYAYALFDAGGFFRVAHGVARDRVTPEVRYLAARSNFIALRHDHGARVSPGYGTASYYRKLDAEAPRPLHHGPAAGKKIAYVIYNYPIGYYALAALAMAGAYAASHGSLVATYFAARALGVGSLAVTLVCAHAIFRACRISRNVSLMLTAAFGYLPLTSWVSAYIQPDTLTVACVTVALLLTIRLRERPFDTRLTAYLGLALATTFFVKQHYGLVLTVASDIAIAGYALRMRPSARALASTFAACVVIPIVSYVAATHITPIGALVTPPILTHAAPAASPLAALSHEAAYARRGFYDVFVAGVAFATYWAFFGDLFTPYIGDQTLLSACEHGIGIASLLVLVTIAYRQMRVYLALFRIARRHARLGFSLLLGDPVLNLYVAWTVFLLAVYARSLGVVFLEGRYFLAMTVPAMLIGVRYLPRVFARRMRARISFGIAGAWLAASVVLAPIAYLSMERRFYGPAPVAAAARTDRFERASRMQSAARTTNAQSVTSRGTASEKFVAARSARSGSDAR